jgi:hypothetical protein
MTTALTSAEVGVGDADDGDILDRRVHGQPVLHLPGIDVHSIEMISVRRPVREVE